MWVQNVQTGSIKRPLMLSMLIDEALMLLRDALKGNLCAASVFLSSFLQRPLRPPVTPRQRNKLKSPPNLLFLLHFFRPHSLLPPPFIPRPGPCPLTFLYYLFL